MTLHRKRSRQAGVSLIEALVALAVMAFGMLSLVGVQATLRLNSDLAKQRTEATRIAGEQVENLRLFSVMAAANGAVSYDGIAAGSVDYKSVGGIGNTTYNVKTTVGTLTNPARKVVSVTVSWNDRTNTLQTVTLDSAIAGVDPVLSGLLSVPPQPSATNQVNGRHPTIPPSAVDQGDGTSKFKPPGSDGVSWVFNNLSGALCVVTNQACVPAMLISGAVGLNAQQEHGGDAALYLASGPNAMVLTSPPDQSVATCYADATNLTQAPANYYCAVTPVANPNVNPPGWGGKIDVVPPVDGHGNALVLGFQKGQYQVCRYTQASTNYTVNSDHPKTYCLTTPPPNPVTAGYLSCLGTRVATNLINQNFLVVDGQSNCPTDVPVNPLTGHLVDINTLPHQP